MGKREKYTVVQLRKEDEKKRLPRIVLEGKPVGTIPTRRPPPRRRTSQGILQRGVQNS